MKPLFLTLTTAGAVLLGLLFASPVQAVHDIDQFELEGNALDNGAKPGDDWETLHLGGGSAFEFTGVTPDASPFSIFTGGRKDIQPINQWGWKDGSVPDKNDITNAYAGAYTHNGDLIVYFGADRFSNVGDAFLGFWFFQQEVGLNNDGSFSGEHAPGDVLVLVNFPQANNAVPLMQVVEWDTSCAKADNNDPAVNECAAQNLRLRFSGTGEQEVLCGNSDNDLVCAITNLGDEQAPWNYTPKDGVAGTFPFESFFEGGINLTEVIGGDTCFSSFMAETRSSSSFTASLKDFVLDSFPLCEITLTKTCVGTPVIDPSDFASILSTFDVTIENTGFAPVYNVEVVDDFCTTDTGDDAVIINEASLDPGSENAVTYRLVCDTVNNPATNKATAMADSAPVGGTLLTDDTSATCPALAPNPDLLVTKTCETALEQVEGKIVVRVDAEVTVTNTGEEKLVGIEASDSKISSLTPPSGFDGTLLPSFSAIFTGSYYPSAPDDTVTIGGDESVPSEVLFKDTANAKGVGAISGTLVEPVLGVEATCPLCP